MGLCTEQRIRWLVTSLLVGYAQANCGPGEALMEGILIGWSAGVVVELSADSNSAAVSNNGNRWSVCVPSTPGQHTIRISSDVYTTVTENSLGQSPANELTLINVLHHDATGLSFTLEPDYTLSTRILNTFSLPAPESIVWIASLPGFQLLFAIAETNDRAYESSLASFGNCSTPLVGSGLSISGPQFLPDQLSLTDTVTIDVDQLSASVYQVNSADDTMATLQFCHILTMYSRDPEIGTVSSDVIHKSQTKVSADINLLRPFTTPSIIQLSTEPESVEVDGGLIPDVNVFSCDSNKQEIAQATLTAGDTIRICVGTSPPPDSITDINLAATPSTGGATESYRLVSGGLVQRRGIPGEITLGDCSNDICLFDFSPQFSFFLDTSYSMTLTGTILLRIGSRHRQRQMIRKLQLSSAQFGLTVMTAVSSPNEPSAAGISTVGVTALVVLAIVVLTMSAIYYRHRYPPSKALESPDKMEAVELNDSDESAVDCSDGEPPSILSHQRVMEDVVEFSDTEV